MTNSKAENRKLHNLYTDLSKNNTTAAAAYGSIQALQKASGLPRRKVLEYLYSSATYTKFKTPIRRFPRLKAVSQGIDEIWSMDLAFVDKLASVNNNTHYLLVCVDILSRFTRVQPMVNKTAETATRALKKMTLNVAPHKIWVDKGTEFEGAFRRYCHKRGIIVYSTHSETKSAYAERYIRTLKNIIYKYLEQQTTDQQQQYNLRRRRRSHPNRYIDELQNFVTLMNTRVNRVTKLAPAAVKREDTKYLISLTKSSKPQRAARFKVGDTVRIAKLDIQFRKGYKQQFTNELFTINRIATRNPPTYVITAKEGEKIKGKFYEPELIKYNNVSSSQ